MSAEVIVNTAVLVLIGAVAGWIAGIVTRGKGSGVIMNTVAGVSGLLLARVLLPLIGVELDNNMIGTVTTALVGSVFVVILMATFTAVVVPPPPPVQREAYRRR